MKFQVIFLIALIAGSAWAETSLLQSKAQMAASAQDAVDDALAVLVGLKEANEEAQRKADEENKAKEAAMKIEIDELFELAEAQKRQGEAATVHRKYIESEIETTNQYLIWLVARREELNRKRGELQEQRCVASMQFVKALKEHDEALQVIALLKRDVVGIVKEKTGLDYTGLSQMKDKFQKLGEYAHLFNEKAMEDFAQLQQSNPAQYVNPETGEWDEDATDNTKAALQVEHGEYKAAERDIEHRFIDMINKLEQHLIQSRIDLKENEIQAAWDLVIWLQASEAELVWLDDEQAAKTIYIDKLTINVVGAKNNEDRLWEIYFETSATYNDALAAREKIRAAYLAEKARRLEENVTLDGVITMFKEQVAILAKKSRAATTDHADDGSFNQSYGGDYNADKVDSLEGSVARTNARANAAAAAPAL